MSGAICQIPWLEQKNDLDNAKAVFRNYKERFKFAKISSDPMGIDQKFAILRNWALHSRLPA